MRPAIPSTFVALVLLAAPVLPASAQSSSDPSGRYAKFPLPSDLKSAFKDRLKQSTGLASIESLPAALKKLDLAKLLGPGAQERLDELDDFTKSAIDRYFESMMMDPERAPAIGEWIKKNVGKRIPGRINGGIDELLKTMSREELLRVLSVRRQEKLPTPPTEPVEPPPDEFKDWLADVMERAEQSRWGEVLQKSPGWQKVLEDMKSPSVAADSKAMSALTSWASNLKWRPDIKLDLKNLRLPDLSRLRFQPPSFPSLRFSLPQAGLPSFAPPSFSGSVSGPFQALGWVVIVVSAVVLLRLVLRSRTGRFPARKKALGPWPIAPGEVSTRQQLVQAFDYLAVLHLGTEAQSWNHSRAAIALGTDEATRQAAQRLAGIYETARYTAGPDELPERQREAARQDLCMLSQAHSR